MNLIEHIANKNPGGIAFDDSRQLFLWLYCTMDFVPLVFRNKENLGKKELAIGFAKLAADGRINRMPDGIAMDNLLQESYWVSIVDDLLRKKIILDENFRSRISEFI